MNGVANPSIFKTGALCLPPRAAGCRASDLVRWHLSDPYGAGHREPAYWGKAEIRVPNALVVLRGRAPGVSAVIHWVSARRKNGGSPTVSPDFQPIAFTSSAQTRQKHPEPTHRRDRPDITLMLKALDCNGSSACRAVCLANPFPLADRFAGRFCPWRAALGPSDPATAIDTAAGSNSGMRPCPGRYTGRGSVDCSADREPKPGVHRTVSRSPCNGPLPKSCRG